MAYLDVHILAQAILYLSAFVTGFVICIPVGVNRINFNGKCILYADFQWKNATAFKMTGSQELNCNIPIYFSVFGLIFYGLGVGLYNGYAVMRSTKDNTIGSQMWVMPFILLNILLSCTTFVVACMLSVGFKQFCDGLQKTGTYKSCRAGENVKWIDLENGKKFDTGPYFKLITVAQVAAWLCFLIWVLQVAMCVLRFFRNRRGRSAQMFDAAQKSETTADTSKIAELEPTA